MCGKRDHGIADLVREAVSHGADQAQIGGLDFKPPQDPRLEPVGTVNVACHLYDSEASG